MKPVIDPRGGDVEDDASSTKRRSLLSLAGSLLAEISLQANLVLDNAVRCSRSAARTRAACCFRLGEYGLTQDHIPSSWNWACVAPCDCARYLIVRSAIAVSYGREQFLVFEFACRRADIRRLPGRFAAPRRKTTAIATQ